VEVSVFKVSIYLLSVPRSICHSQSVQSVDVLGCLVEVSVFDTQRAIVHYSTLWDVLWRVALSELVAVACHVTGIGWWCIALCVCVGLSIREELGNHVAVFFIHTQPRNMP
jgi:hypothetical protein